MTETTLAILGALALLTRFGHTLHIMGAVRARSVAAVAARSLIGTACLVLLTFVAGRAYVRYIDNAGIAGSDGIGAYFRSPGTFLSILALALLPASMIGGATAERARVRGSLTLVIGMTVFVLPALAWIGSKIAGSIDGDSPGMGLLWPLIAAHLVAATSGLSLAWAIGPRSGKYNRDGSANFIPAHSLPTMITGDLLLLIGVPMMAVAAVGDDPAGRVVNALLAASAATIAAVFISTIRERRFDVMQPWSAALAGSVCGSLSTAGAPMLAILLGTVVGLLLPILSIKIDLRWRIDETSGLALPHLLGATLGAIGAATGPYVGAFSPTRSLPVALLAMCGAVVVMILGAIIATTLPAILLHRLGWLRVSEEVEREGLDLGQHDINAYPDFQQTMIKSYHLRQ